MIFQAYGSIAFAMSSLCINFHFPTVIWSLPPYCFSLIYQETNAKSVLYTSFSTLHTVNRCFYAFFSSNSSTTAKVPQGQKWESNIPCSLWASAGYPVLQLQLHSPSTNKVGDLHKNRTEDWWVFLVAKSPKKLKTPTSEWGLFFPSPFFCNLTKKKKSAMLFIFCLYLKLRTWMFLIRSSLTTIFMEKRNTSYSKITLCYQDIKHWCLSRNKPYIKSLHCLTHKLIH